MRNSSNLLATVFAVVCLTLPAQKVIRTVSGPSGSTGFGEGVAGAGDFNADGVPDIVVGTGGSTGGVRVYSGRDGSVLFQRTGTPGSRLGSSVAGIGDIDGDGYDDVAAGAPRSWPFPFGAGYAEIYSGRTSAVLYTYHGTSASDAVGESVAGAGDVNDDGYADFIIGAPNVPVGAARIYSGRDGTLIHTLLGAPNEYFGAATAAAGDVNGDGYDDVIVGASAPASLGAGRAVLFSGRDGSQLREFKGTTFGDFFGTSVDGGEDVNGDGVPDLIIGASGVASFSGSAQIYSGANGTLLLRLAGSAGDGLGIQTALLGDLDGDGRSEFAVGAFTGVSGPGFFEVHTSTGTKLFRVTGSAPRVRLGSNLAAAGDLNLDGRPDVLVAAPDEGTGVVRAYELNSTNDLGRLLSYGRGCPSTGPRLPKLTMIGQASLGKTCRVSLRGGPKLQPAILHLATRRASLDLTFLGMPNCLMLTQPVLNLGFRTDATGRSSLGFVIPSTSVVGASTIFQYSILAPGANALGVVTSNGGELVVGRG